MATGPRKYSAENVGAMGLASVRSVVLAVVALVAMGVGLFYEEQAAQRDLQSDIAMSRGADGGVRVGQSFGDAAQRAGH